jgi:hypothetical protein
MVYAPGTLETDQKKQNMALQQQASAISTIQDSYVASFNSRTGAVTPAQGDYPTSLIPGTTTNDSATAGNIGEYISSTVLSGSAVAATSGVVFNITSISLTAGDWDVWGNVAITPSVGVTTTAIVGSASSTSATHPSFPGGGAFLVKQLAFTSGATQAYPIGMARFSLASTTTVYLVCTLEFSGGSLSGYGFIGARRAR